LLVLWVWQAARRRADARRLAQRRAVPVRERFGLFGDLLFWLFVIAATASTIVAVARPSARTAVVRTAGIDLVILADGSTSMRVADVEGDRWQRTMRFLRQLGESLNWENDRIALALFARIATPQIRLTRDPNTYFFFLDHLTKESPFRLEDLTSWDTNTERGIRWGLRLIEKDEEVHGKSANTKTFILLSDGQAWSGEVERALAEAKRSGFPIYTIGVGTTTGGFIPEPPQDPESKTPPPDPVFSMLDRSSLRVIAAAGGGQYFELDLQPDREIANEIIAAARRRAGFTGIEETSQSLAWRCLVLAAALMCLGLVFLRERAELWLYAGGAGLLLATVFTVIR
jgi:Ca-activated chloride channel family protein